MTTPDDGAASDGSSTGWRRWGRGTAATIAVAAALAGIFFNAWSAHQQSVSQRATRRAAQLGLITQLDAAANDSESAIGNGRIPDKLCRTNFVSLSSSEASALFSALGHFEYFAWLSNTHQLDDITTARSYWARRMLDAFNVARGWYSTAELDRDFPQLSAFRRATPRALWPAKRCS